MRESEEKEGNRTSQNVIDKNYEQGNQNKERRENFRKSKTMEMETLCQREREE